MTRRRLLAMLGLAAALAAGSAGGVVDAGERRDGDYPAAAVQNFLNGNGLNHLPSAAFEHSTPTVLKNLNKDARGSKGDNRHDAPGGTSPQ